MIEKFLRLLTACILYMEVYTGVQFLSRISVACPGNKQKNKWVHMNLDAYKCLHIIYPWEDR